MDYNLVDAWKSVLIGIAQFIPVIYRNHWSRVRIGCPVGLLIIIFVGMDTETLKNEWMIKGHSSCTYNIWLGERVASIE